MGKIAIANAKLAYQRYKKYFESERFAKLADKGARVQRPLWASTSTKNPEYPDTAYVDTLIGKHTVNTAVRDGEAITIDAAGIDRGHTVEFALQFGQHVHPFGDTVQPDL